MPDLLTQITDFAGSADLAGPIGEQAATLVSLGTLVAQLAAAPPDDFGDYLRGLGEGTLPDVDIGGALAGSFGAIAPDIEGNLGGLLEPLLEQVAGLAAGPGDALGGPAMELLERIEQLRTLLAHDWSCGLVPALAPPPANPITAPADAATDPGPDSSADPGAGAGGDADPGAAAPPAPAPAVGEAEIAHLRTMLDDLPAELTVPELLRWLHARIGTWRPGYVQLRAIPLIDDLRDPLETLVRWDQQDGAALEAELVATLDLLATLIGDNTVAALETTFAAARLPAGEITAQGAAADALAAALDALRSTVQAGDAAAIDAALAAATSARQQFGDTTAALLAHEQDLAALQADLASLPTRLERGMSRLLVALQPRAGWATLSDRLGPLETPVADDTFDAVQALLDETRTWLDTLLSLVDTRVVTEPLTDMLAEVEGAIARVEQGLVQLVSEARALFEQALSTLQSFDLGALQAEAEAAVEAAMQQVQQLLGAGAGAAAAALGSALDAVDAALAALDPAALGAPVQSALEQLRDLLSSPAVEEILALFDRLNDAGAALQQLSFQPVADTVIEGIDSVRQALESIDPDRLPPPAPEMIGAAMSVLPPSLEPAKVPLRSGLDQLIDRGPVAALQALRELPAELFAAIDSFSPRSLLEEPLGTPHRALEQQLDQLDPQAWLAGADDAVDELRQRLANQLDLDQLLEPVDQARQELLGALRGFRPGALVEPLEQQLEQAAAQFADLVPTQVLIEALDQVFSQVRRLRATLEGALAALGELLDRIATLSDPGAQFDAWIDDILGKLPASAAATLQPALERVAAALDRSRCRRDTDSGDDFIDRQHLLLRAPLAEALAAAQPAAALTALVQAHARLRALPTGTLAAPQRSALEGLLADFDPGAPAINAGLRRLARLEDALAASDQALARAFTDWNARYHAADGVLATLVPRTADGNAQILDLPTLQDWLRDAIERQLGAPVRSFLGSLGVLHAMLSRFRSAATGLLTALATQLEQSALAAPQALLDAANRLQSLQDRLRGLDLGFVSQSLDAAYTQLLEQIAALDPTALAAPVQQTLDAALDALSLDTLFTPALRGQLDQQVATLRARVAALDPEALIIAPLEQFWESDLLPQVRRLDATPAIDAVIARLEALPEELAGELDRVDTAYQAMRAAAPTGGLQAAAGAALGAAGGSLGF